MISSEFVFEISLDFEGERVDKFLSQSLPDFTRSRIQKIIEEDGVLVNGKKVNKNYKLSLDDTVLITLPDNKELNIMPENIPLNIVYEDNDLLVVNKEKSKVSDMKKGIDFLGYNIRMDDGVQRWENRKIYKPMIRMKAKNIEFRWNSTVSELLSDGK